MRNIIIALMLGYTTSTFSAKTESNISVFANQIYKNSKNTSNSVYIYGTNKIDLKLYLYNLGTNVNSYVDSRNWNSYMRDEFINAYNNIIKALQEKRLSADSFGNITDQEGKLSNIDEDDYWYNKKGERITGEEYQNLSARKKKRYITFHANKEVATYFSRIAQDIIKKGGATSIY